MSVETAGESYIFHTDIGVVNTVTSTVDGYDIEDIVADRAYSQAVDILFQTAASNVDINDPTSPRTMSSTYLQGST
jgi:hypothetical protein